MKSANHPSPIVHMCCHVLLVLPFNYLVLPIIDRELKYEAHNNVHKFKLQLIL